MQRIVRPGLLLLAGCGGSVGIGTREEGSLGDVLQIVQAVGVVTELAAHGVLDVPENEPTCPRVSRIEGFSTVDYGEGCLPDSGLVPAGLSGSARLDIGDRVSADLEGVLLGSVDLYGVLDAGEAPRDYFGRPFIYTPPTSDRPYTLSSLGRDGTPGGMGEDADTRWSPTVGVTPR